MSCTEIYSVTKDSCNKLGETKNAHRGAMYVWNDISKRYFGLDMFPIFDEKMQRRVWNAGDEHKLSEFETIVLASTMDRVTVKAKDAGRLVKAFEAYAENHPNSSLGEQAKVIKDAVLEPGDKISWCQTSVCDFQFSPQYNEDSDTYIYDDLEDSWDLFEQFDALSSRTPETIQAT